jgi:hypothetical protein
MPPKGSAKAKAKPSPSTQPHTAETILGAAVRSDLQELRDAVSTLSSRLSALESKSPAVPAPTPSGASIASVSTPASRGRSRSKKPRPTFTGIPATVAVPLSGHHPRDDSPDRYTASLVIAEDLVGHVVGRGGRGLKQVSDISGARLQVFGMMTDGREERHVTIRGTELQLGEALIVLGKRIARKRVHAPAKKKKGSSSPGGESAPPPPVKPPTPAPEKVSVRATDRD